MKKRLYSAACPFDLSDWSCEKLSRVYAGAGCAMALTEDGRVLQKVSDEGVAARLDYWKNICDISVSQCFSGLSVGLVKDGTCMVSKRALRRCCELTGGSFDAINSRIKALTDIVQVCVSDAIFALDAFGRVHKILLGRRDAYPQVERWEDIARLAVGSQDLVIGITRAGKLLCDGGNSLRGPHGDLRPQLAACNGVVDVGIMGSEGERLLLALEDGSVADHRGNVLQLRHKGCGQVFCGNFLLCAILRENDSLGFVPYCSAPEEWDALTKLPADSFAVGLTESYAPFAIVLSR